jgi:hypothetical protein
MKALSISVAILYLIVSGADLANCRNREFSVFFEMGSANYDDGKINERIINNGYEKDFEGTPIAGIGTRWKCSDRLSIVIYHNIFDIGSWDDLRTDSDYYSAIESFGRNTVIGFEYQFEEFPMNLIRPGLGIGFGSVQLQNPPKASGYSFPFYFRNLMNLDSLLINPSDESKLSKRLGLLDLSLATDLKLILSDKERDKHVHYIGFGFKAGYIFTFITSDWRMGPLKVRNGPDIDLQYFYIKMRWIYGGRW